MNPETHDYFCDCQNYALAGHYMYGINDHTKRNGRHLPQCWRVAERISACEQASLLTLQNIRKEDGQ